MTYAQQVLGPFTLSGYHYEGQRPSGRTCSTASIAPALRSSSTRAAGRASPRCRPAGIRAAIPRRLRVERRIQPASLRREPAVLCARALRGHQRYDRRLHAGRRPAAGIPAVAQFRFHDRGRRRARAANDQHDERSAHDRHLMRLRTFAVAALAVLCTAAAAQSSLRRFRSTCRSQSAILGAARLRRPRHRYGSGRRRNGRARRRIDDSLKVTAVLDATRIRTGDDDRDGVLQTPDWFDTAKFPTWTFTSTKISPSGSDAFSMDGLLTMHGVTQSERLDVSVGETSGRPAITRPGRSTATRSG